MDVLVLFLAVLAGAALGSWVTFFIVTSPLLKQVLLMKREGFVSYPKVIPPPKLSSKEYRED